MLTENKIFFFLIILLNCYTEYDSVVALTAMSTLLRFAFVFIIHFIHPDLLYYFLICEAKCEEVALVLNVIAFLSSQYEVYEAYTSVSTTKSSGYAFLAPSLSMNNLSIFPKSKINNQKLFCWFKYPL